MDQIRSQKLSSQLRSVPSFVDLNRCSKPRNATEAWSRLEVNLSWYWLNYSIIATIILIVAIITQPSFLITIIILSILWWYSLSHETIVIPRVGYVIAGKTKMIALYCSTAVLLILFAGTTILFCVGIAALLIVGHAIFRAVPSQEERDAAEEMVQMSVV